MFKPGQVIINYLKSQGRNIDLPLDQLRQFQEFERMIQARFESYEGKEFSVTYGMQSFITVQMLVIAIMATGEFPALQRCYDDLLKLFKHDKAFDDGISLESWIFFNFPATRGGHPIGREVLLQSSKTASTIALFVEKALESRLGLYEVVKDGADQCQLKELFTNRKIIVGQSLGGVERSTIALCRVIEIGGKHWVFGNTAEFPAARRSLIENMVEDKMSIYFYNGNDLKSYETMMRLAGPYWFSIMASDDSHDILNPDHYLQYYKV
jgi:hypothetical protein